MIRQSPSSLGSPLRSLASFTYPALETRQPCGCCAVQNLFRERTAHCISNFCEPVSSFSFSCITIDLSSLFLRQASSSCFTSSAGIFHRTDIAPPSSRRQFTAPLLILSCRHELLIYPSRSSRLSSGGGIPSRIRCLHIERRVCICACLSSSLKTTLSCGPTARPTTTINTHGNWLSLLAPVSTWIRIATDCDSTSPLTMGTDSMLPMLVSIPQPLQPFPNRSMQTNNKTFLDHISHPMVLAED